jgi:hypothetical protein
MKKSEVEIRLEAFSILWDRYLRKWYQKNEAKNDYPVDSAKEEFLKDIKDLLYLDGYDICSHLDSKGWNGLNAEAVFLADNFRTVFQNVSESYSKEKK